MKLLDKAKELFHGVKEEDMTRLLEVSLYNSNYYAINGNLLYGESDDDNFTQWYWVLGDKSIAIGGSFTSLDDEIIVDYAYQ